MKLLYLPAAALLAATLAGGAHAAPYDPDEERSHRDAVAYRLLFVSPDGEEVQAMVRRDLKFADEMIEHHRGAVRMSHAYLHDPRGTNPFLRRMLQAIIDNQRFEIGWLEDLRDRVAEGPQTVIALGGTRLVALPAGVAGMEHRVRFQRTSITTPADLMGAAGEPASEFDVMFSKAMIMHHQMALDMVHAYNADPDGGNVVIREINFDILRDQAVEIAMLEDVISDYPGDPDTVPIDPAMHDMMGMPHG